MAVFYQIIRSRRKTIAIQIRPDGQVVVRCPQRMRMTDIQKFVESKSEWIENHLAKLDDHREPPLTAVEIEHLRERTRQIVTERAAYYAPIVGVTYHRIAIRTQHTRWGSCSSKGNLNFNCLLALTPPEVADYVVVHELCHRREMNHSARFWSLVEAVLPDYRDSKKWLKENGSVLMARLPEKVT